MPDKNKKFDPEARTFETRLLFIRELFQNTYSKDDILASCIEHKLKRSFESLLEELNYSAWKIQGENPIEVLKRLDF